MNIGYVRLNKKTKICKGYYLRGVLDNIKFYIKSWFNIAEKDKYNENVFYLNNLKAESKNKLINKLLDEKIDCAIVENNNLIEFPKLNGTYLMRVMIPEIVDYCYEKIKPEQDEVYVCTEVFSFENVRIIEELTKKTKVVNVVTSHRRYRNLEKRLEDRGIFITVSGNKRQSLKKAEIVVNLDLDDLTIYNINRNMCVVDVTGNVKMPRSFVGDIIRKVSVDTKKVMRVFSEFENFNRQDLIEAELIKLNDYDKAREYVLNNRICINQDFEVKYNCC